MPAKPDRRVLRTRTFLFDALISLLKEKPFNAISITDLTERANIARPTFYRNYPNIISILLEELDFRAEGYMVEISGIISRCDSLETLMNILFNRWNDNADLFNAMYRAEMDNHILDRFVSYSRQMLDVINQGFAPMTLNPHLYFFAGGAHNLFKNWLLTGRKESVDDMAVILARSLAPLVMNPTLGKMLPPSGG
jgi:AcrR family transcriptional regulator